MASEYETLQATVTGRKRNVGLIRFNRPDVLNALNATFTREFVCALEALESSNEIAVIVCTGNGRAFSAGADVQEFASIPNTEHIVETFLTPMDRIMNITKPIIAAINGYAIGGGLEIALMCDICYASSDARFALPETAYGLIPGLGGIQRITRVIGKSLTMDMMLTRRRLTAQEALELNIVSRLFPPEKLVDETIAIAEQIASNPYRGTELSKRAVNTAFEYNLRDALTAERSLFLTACRSIESERTPKSRL